VVSAIGHDGDRPLCDEVADLRCGTPSLAATAVLPDLTGLGRALDSCLAAAASAVTSCLDGAERRLSAVDTGRALQDGLRRAEAALGHAGVRLAAAHPSARLAAGHARLAAATAWRRHIWEALGRAEGRLDADRRHLAVLSPQRTLERGYSVVTLDGKTVIRRARDLSAGDSIKVRLAEGEVAATVTEVDTGEASR